MSLGLYLREAVSFEPVGKVTNVFYDDANQMILSVRSGGVCGIVLKGFQEGDNSTFRLEDQCPSSTIQISPDKRILAVQPSPKEVRFYGVLQTGSHGQLDSRHFSQGPKARTDATIQGFAWLDASDVVYFTSQGIELFSVSLDRRLVKHVRNLIQLTSWYVFCPRASIAILAQNSLAKGIQPFYIKSGSIYKMPKIEYEGVEAKIREKDVAILCLYDQTYISVTLPKEDSSVEIHLYAVTKEHSQVTKSKILEIPSRGQVCVSVVDDLLLVHHQASLITYCFDVALAGSFDGTATHHVPICSGQVSIESDEHFEMYSPHWVTFQPDILVDAKVGRMWKLHLVINASIVADIQELPNLVSFLMERRDAKSVLTSVLLQQIPETRLDPIRKAFDIINAEYAAHLIRQAQPSIAQPAHTFSSSSSCSALYKLATAATKSPAKVVLEQGDMYTHILAPMQEGIFCSDLIDPDGDTIASEKRRRRQRLIAVLNEYFSSLLHAEVKPLYFLDELYINLYVQGHEWYQIQQLMQYQVISDSKPMACLLLSLEKVFPASYQLAMDMLHRLKNSNEEICEILISKGRVMSALLFASSKNLGHIPPRKFLEAALEQGGDMDFYNVYDYYRRKEVLASGGYEQYIEEFGQRYPKQAAHIERMKTVK